MAGTPGVRLSGVLPPQLGACTDSYGETHGSSRTSEPPPPPPSVCLRCFLSFCVAHRQTSSVDMMNVDGAGTSAMRRRQRRLRAMLRHEMIFPRCSPLYGHDSCVSLVSGSHLLRVSAA